MAEVIRNTNVVCLPTAASCKVRQPMNSAGRTARRAIREASPWPGAYVEPQVRQATFERTPELLIAMVIFKALTPEQKEMVRGEVDRIYWLAQDTASLRASELLARIHGVARVAGDA